MGCARAIAHAVAPHLRGFQAYGPVKVRVGGAELNSGVLVCLQHRE
jgi:hypothetical protein